MYFALSVFSVEICLLSGPVGCQCAEQVTNEVRKLEKIDVEPYKLRVHEAAAWLKKELADHPEKVHELVEEYQARIDGVFQPFSRERESEYRGVRMVVTASADAKAGRAWKERKAVTNSAEVLSPGDEWIYEGGEPRGRLVSDYGDTSWDITEITCEMELSGRKVQALIGRRLDVSATEVSSTDVNKGHSSIVAEVRCEFRYSDTAIAKKVAEDLAAFRSRAR
jgi:hypothetical protein